MAVKRTDGHAYSLRQCSITNKQCPGKMPCKNRYSYIGFFLTDRARKPSNRVKGFSQSFHILNRSGQETLFTHVLNAEHASKAQTMIFFGLRKRTFNCLFAPCINTFTQIMNEAEIYCCIYREISNRGITDFITFYYIISAGILQTNHIFHTIQKSGTEHIHAYHTAYSFSGICIFRQTQHLFKKHGAGANGQRV